MSSDLLGLLRSKGVLVEKEVFDLLSSIKDTAVIDQLIDNLVSVSGQKMITKSSLTKNILVAQKVVSDVSSGIKPTLIQLFVKLGLQVVVTETPIEIKKIEVDKKQKQNYSVHYANTTNEKKITVQDFVGHFRSRYKEIQNMLMQRSSIDKLISINKISGTRQQFMIIGMVNSKRYTKNKNLMVTFEDMTGQITVLFKAQSEFFKPADELQLDEVVAVKCSGNLELVVGHDVIFPDAVVSQKTKFEEDCGLAFISDIHVGSHKFLATEFNRFIEWLDSEDDLAQKIKYIFIIGDSVDGVGVFPGQERFLQIKTLKGQYDELATYLKRIPQRITVFMCPGQHDASRVPEPQPVVDRSYAGALYDIPNLVLVSNPCLVKLLEKEKEFKVQMYHGASIHAFINNIEELRLIKAHKHPARAVKHMLKRRHLAPSHGVSASIVYVPNIDKDPLVISEVPDIMAIGEVHRLDIERHNGILILTGNCWQAQTEFEEKIGNIPDPCKVPIFNIKTHELKILDFNNIETPTEAPAA
ncbi:MAG: OB-fold nucleic acid binding domain-containing protein [Candidatus Pacearchaeota archaeon]